MVNILAVVQSHSSSNMLQAILGQLTSFVESTGTNMSMVGLGVETQALAQRAQLLIIGKIDELRYAAPDGGSGASTPVVGPPASSN